MDVKKETAEVSHVLSTGLDGLWEQNHLVMAVAQFLVSSGVKAQSQI